ncbi:uncharacterized protein LOC143204065 isoform X2 [Rhynchophorus ferrugineus]|uniref:uncharacterized protein LOC143204065 isoform X2 n=1 Tax=Rhynchophorus ferrugineus TaxID=354439 RepID=UPI003FCE86C8
MLVGNRVVCCVRPYSRMVQVTNQDYDEEATMLNSPSPSQPADTKSIMEDAYRGISRGMMADPLKSSNPQVNLELMDTALRNRNAPLAKSHIDQLYNQIDKDNALNVMNKINKRVFRTDNEPSDFEPSAPPLVESYEECNDNWMVVPLYQLRDKCLLVVESNGDYVLKKKEVEDLHYNDLHQIAFNDKLVVSSELVVYSAIMRWCRKQCEVKGSDCDNTNVKSILKDLVYATRYGLMSEKDFLARTIDEHKGPDRMGILSEKETDEILDYIRQRKKKKKDLKELPYKMSRERCGLTKPKECNSKVEGFVLNVLACWATVFD